MFSGGTGWRVEDDVKCSWGAVLVADLVTQLPELVNLAAGKASAIIKLFHFCSTSLVNILFKLHSNTFFKIERGDGFVCFLLRSCRDRNADSFVCLVRLQVGQSLAHGTAKFPQNSTVVVTRRYVVDYDFCDLFPSFCIGTKASCSSIHCCALFRSISHHQCGIVSSTTRI